MGIWWYSNAQSGRMARWGPDNVESLKRKGVGHCRAAGRAQCAGDSTRRSGEGLLHCWDVRDVALSA